MKIVYVAFPDNDYHEAEYLIDEDIGADDFPITYSESATPPSTPSPSLRARNSAPMKKRNIQEKMLELAEKENTNMEKYLEHARRTDVEIIMLMKENNALMKQMIDKM